MPCVAAIAGFYFKSGHTPFFKIKYIYHHDRTVHVHVLGMVGILL